MNIRLIVLFPLITAMIFTGTLPVSAQTDNTTATETTSVNDVESLVSASEAIDPTYEGITIEEPSSVPNAFGLLFQDVRERLSVFFTFNQTAKAEKTLKYAEEHLLLAERAFETAENETTRRQAYAILQKSQDWLNHLQKAQDKALEQNDERMARLLRNRATLFEHQQAILDRIEEKVTTELSREDIHRLLSMRASMLKAHERLANAIQNTNIPEDVRTRLSEISVRIETHAQSVKEAVQESQDLINQAQTETSDAQARLETWRERRLEILRKQIQDREQKMESFQQTFETKLDDLLTKSEAGDQEAAATLERIKNNPELRLRLNAALENNEENEQEEEKRQMREQKTERLRENTEDNESLDNNTNRTREIENEVEEEG